MKALNGRTSILLARKFLAMALCCMPIAAISQTNIGGIINTYVKVSSINSSCSCPSGNCATTTVTSSTGFSVGDKVLIIQMKGATANTTNTESHGSITSLNDAGHYEFAMISSIAGNVITLVDPLKETYFTGASPADSACVQLIRVPVYSGAVTVTSTLTAQAWNGVTGGVLAFETDGSLTLSANITVDGKGYKAARQGSVAVSCGSDTAYYYQSTTWNYSSCGSCGYVYDDASSRRVGVATYGGCGSPCFTNRMNTQDNRLGAYRGDGVVANTFTKTFANLNVAIFDKGKGHWGNGGGGGGNHNAGGGGGGNYGAGGYGGYSYNVFGGGGCPVGTHLARRGRGGSALTPTSSRVFMGGGGGEGHNNGGGGTTGTAGGGIIFITAASVTNSGSYTISANGVDNTTGATNDGSGGGGAGGSILMDVSGSYTNAITISAKGGKGGDHVQSNCHGTGGGGGGGLIWFSNASPPSNVTTTVTGGANGTNTHPSFDCGDANWGATAGASGTVTYQGSSGFFNANSCFMLPVEVVSFTAAEVEGIVRLRWTISSQQDHDYYSVERSADAKVFTAIEKVEAAGSNIRQTEYSADDEQPLDGANYYRLKQVDENGGFEYSPMIKTVVNAPQLEWSLAPNPAANYVKVSVTVTRKEPYSIRVYSVNGEQVIQQVMSAVEGRNDVYLDISQLPAGCYSLVLSDRKGNHQARFVKQ